MQVSELCRDRMHEFLAEELAAEEADLAQRLRRRQQQPEAAAGEGTSAGSWAVKQQQLEEERAWRAALERTFRRVDAMASLACACGRIVSPPCRCPLSGNSGIVGSTAVVALLVRGHLVVANCGDSRAVLCRGGSPPVQLSDDHKVPFLPLLFYPTRPTTPHAAVPRQLTVDSCVVRCRPSRSSVPVVAREAS